MANISACHLLLWFSLKLPESNQIVEKGPIHCEKRKIRKPSSASKEVSAIFTSQFHLIVLIQLFSYSHQEQHGLTDFPEEQTLQDQIRVYNQGTITKGRCLKSYLKPQVVFLSQLTLGLAVFLESDEMAQYWQALSDQRVACQIFMVACLAVYRLLLSLDPRSILSGSLTFLLCRGGIFVHV